MASKAARLLWPTPAQARIIKALHDDKNQRIYWREGARYADWAYQKANFQKHHGTVRVSTIKKITENGWLECGMCGISSSIHGSLWHLTPEGDSVANQLSDQDLVSTKIPVSTSDILVVLQNRHPLPQWVFVTELRIGTGWTAIRVGNIVKEPLGRIDALALNCYPSKNFLRVAYEVKVSRADFLRELERPEKREVAMALSHKFYFAAPAGVIKPNEIPDLCGLIDIYGDFWKTRVPAPYRPGLREAPWGFVASLARKLAEGKQR